VLRAATVCSLATLAVLVRWYVVRRPSTARNAVRLSDDHSPLTPKRRFLEWTGYWLAVAVVLYVLFGLAYGGL
jgi:hypothetical protein